MINYKKYILGGGVVTFILIGAALTWFVPLYAGAYLLGALGTVVYMEWLSEKDKNNTVSSENDWTGI